MQYTSVFRPLQFGELVAITGLPKSQIQNWTSGRPLWVLPSFSTGEGKGNRDLFALEDAYLFCYLQALKKNGLSTKSLERVVRSFNLWSREEGKPVFRYFRPEVCWLVLDLSKMVLMLHDIKKSADEPNPRYLPQQQVRDFHDAASIQIAVNLMKLRHDVNKKAKKQLPDFSASEDSFFDHFIRE